MEMAKHTFILNGKKVRADVDGDVRLLWVLRDVLGVTGPKYGCGIGVCKACTCHINGKAFNPCCVPVSDVKPTDRITTIEGLAATVGRELHPMQEAWLKVDVAQCGYCQPGQIMSAAALIAEKAAPTDAEIDEALKGNICRCGTYERIRAAVARAAALKGGAR
jgi:isoquinoline 1-oxidoreductase alpha subunit